jgi:hypothetical protein
MQIMDGRMIGQQSVHAGAAFFAALLGRKLAQAVAGASRASGQEMQDAARLERAWSAAGRQN